MQLKMRNNINKDINSTQNDKVLRACGQEPHVLISCGQSGGACGVIRMFASPGHDVPLHTHHFEDKIFIVESGELEVTRGSEVIQARKGDVAYLPKNIPHAPSIVSSENLQVLVLCVPGGFDRYLAACAEEWRKPEPNLQYLD
jgi:quercetin dioxygenase-like cupin family protein